MSEIGNITVNGVIVDRAEIQALATAHGISSEIADSVADEQELINKATAGAEEKAKQGDMFKTSNVGAERLKQYVERIERLEEEKSGLAEDIRDVYTESKSAGFETKIIRQLIKLRKMDHQKRIEQEELLDLYKYAIGLI